MPRRKKSANAAVEAAEAAPATPPVAAETVTPAETPSEPAKDAAKPPVYAPDPHSTISVSLSDHRGGPSMHLLRSHRFNQMQIRFDGQQPGEEHLATLANAGWKDRTESEDIWTKQIDREARWQSVQQMEREFHAVANAIRKEKGLTPVLEGMALA